MINKIVTVIGARPQFIKAAPLSRVFKEKSLEEVVVHTGQHYDGMMSGIFFKELEMSTPPYNLNVGSGSHAQQTGEIMIRLEKILCDEKPDVLVVYGDTNSTIAGALTASKLKIPIAHVEAGLRSFNRTMPEEINRILTDHASDLLFAPTTIAVRNLQREGIVDNVYHVGDVMYDAALQMAQKAQVESRIIDTLSLTPKEFFLVTIHRAENTDTRHLLENILMFLQQCAAHKEVVLPLHPRTRKMIGQYGFQALCKGLRIIEPVGFLDMVRLEAESACIITDSGGVQKEAYFHRVPCVTLRKETEWVETIEARWNCLVAPNSLNSEAFEIVNRFVAGGNRSEITEYGNGTTAQQIADVLGSAI